MRIIGFITCAVLMQGCQAQEAREKMQNLVQQVLEKQPAATLTARQIGPDANAELIKLTRNDDAKVRRIAVYCLDETGGADAAVTFARMTLDDDPQVRGAALQGLIHHKEAATPRTLLDAFDQSRNAYVRQQLMLVAGKLAGVATAEIEQRYRAEQDPQAKEGLVVALAERGDTHAQGEFIGALHASQNRERARYLDYAEQIKAPWLIPALLPVLDDKTPMVWIGVDGKPELPQSLRACDIAVNLIAEISGHRFSFPTAGGINYTDEQLAEVKQNVF